MKYVIVLLSLFGCATYEGTPTTPAKTNLNEPCTVKQSDGGATVTCPDGTSVFIPNGSAGPQGSSGQSMGIITAEATTCPAGSNGGIVVTTFVDVNNDHKLDAGDPITSVNLVCGGLPGVQGVAGQSSSVGVTAALPSACNAGGYTLTMQDGNNLPVSTNICNGELGPVGPQGIAGTNGTNVIPMQFCSGFTQSYPSTFAESGLCINNIVYGVYSANDGFLSELPPGTYSSDGINSSCTFTIGPNCVVSP